MRRTARFTILAAAALMLVPALASAAPSRLVLTGFLVNNTGSGPRLGTAAVTIRIDRFTSDERAAELAAAIHERSSYGLQRELFKNRMGTIQVGRSLGYPIAFARQTEDASGRHLFLILQRRISPQEIFRHTRSVDYPYTVVQIDLDREGRGSGDMLPAARLLVHEDGSVEMRNLLVLPLRLLSLHEARP